MITIAIAGMGRAEMSRLVEQHGHGQIKTEVKSDLDAAFAVKTGQADYYLGACQSGAGAALGVANAILGSSEVVTLSGMATGYDPDAIVRAVEEGKRGFGLSHTHIQGVIPILVGAIIARASRA